MNFFFFREAGRVLFFFFFVRLVMQNNRVSSDVMISFIHIIEENLGKRANIKVMPMQVGSSVDLIRRVA